MAVAFFGAPATAQDAVPLSEFLGSIDRTPISISGRVRYDSSALSARADFVFYDENREGYGVSLDAGRTARERIETECANSGLLISYDDLCEIEAEGTVEVRGGRFFISIENLVSLNKAN